MILDITFRKMMKNKPPFNLLAFIYIFYMKILLNTDQINTLVTLEMPQAGQGGKKFQFKLLSLPFVKTSTDMLATCCMLSLLNPPLKI